MNDIKFAFRQLLKNTGLKGSGQWRVARIQKHGAIDAKVLPLATRHSSRVSHH